MLIISPSQQAALTADVLLAEERFLLEEPTLNIEKSQIYRGGTQSRASEREG
jgi:hypothetical protein